MAENSNNSKESRSKLNMDLPSIEDGGLVDHTVASPALGFGMDRAEATEEVQELEQQQQAAQAAAQHEAAQYATEQSAYGQQSTPPTYQTQGSAVQQESIGTLGKNEVAAVNVNDRSFYVSDSPSPYLSTRQAREDVQTTKRRHSRIVAIVVVVLLLAVVGTGGWFLWNMIGSAEPQKTVERYESAEIEKGEYLESIETTSLVRPINEVTVTPGVSGTITEILTENGADVQEGDHLFHLDNPTISDAVTKAQEAFDALNADIQKKAEALQKAQEDLAKAQAGASTSSNSSSDSSSSSDTQSETDSTTSSTSTSDAVDAATKSVAAAQSNLDAANASLASIQETYNQAVEQLNTLDVYAPISGKICEMSEQAKADNSVSGSTRLCMISDTSRYSITMEIPKAQQDNVSEGQEVRLKFPAIEGLEVTSTVSSIDEGDEDSDVLFATVVIDNPDERITTGIAAEATLVLKSLPDVLIVPNEALHTAENGSTHLDVLLDPSRGIVTDVTVKVLATDGTKAAVEADNIQAGNAVVLPDESSE